MLPELNNFSPPALGLTTLRRYVYGELSAAETEALETQLQQDPEAQARVDALRAEQATFQDVDVAVASASILAAAEEAKAPKKMGWLWGSLLVAAGAGAVVVAMPSQGPEAPSVTRTKGGGPGLELYVNGADGPLRAENGVRLGEGDQIQLKYAASGRKHLMVVSVDGRGAVSPLYASQRGVSLTVEPAGVHVLEGSIILDDATGPEHIIGLFSDTPLEYEQVREAAQDALQRSGAGAHLPDLDLAREDVIETRVMIMKE